MSNLSFGKLVATDSVAKRMDDDSSFNVFIAVSLSRFKDGDWGDVSESDKNQNNESLKNGEGSIHGVYKMSDGKTVVWIFMEWDHKTTTILYPHEW